MPAQVEVIRHIVGHAVVHSAWVPPGLAVSTRAHGDHRRGARGNYLDRQRKPTATQHLAGLRGELAVGGTEIDRTEVQTGGAATPLTRGAPRLVRISAGADLPGIIVAAWAPDTQACATNGNCLDTAA